MNSRKRSYVEDGNYCAACAMVTSKEMSSLFLMSLILESDIGISFPTVSSQLPYSLQDV
jgi:hypothetical protein